MGEHKGAYNAFTYEITDFVKYGENNSINVICDNSMRFDVAPQGGDFNMYGGLYRDAWLIVSDDDACISPLYLWFYRSIYQPAACLRKKGRIAGRNIIFQPNRTIKTVKLNLRFWIKTIKLFQHKPLPTSIITKLFAMSESIIRICGTELKILIFIKQ